jgi:enamine deaminase RidA (YjgF/YER057c/UK114 family)
MNFDQRLEDLFIDLPEPPQTKGKGVNAVRTGKLLYVGGVLPRSEGRMMAGRAGVEVRLDMATTAARAAMLFALAIVKSELGGTLNKLKRVVQVSALVACGTDFKDHLKVLDGASDLLVQIFGPSGKHTRISAGVMSLPENATVELSMIVEVK